MDFEILSNNEDKSHAPKEDMQKRVKNLGNSDTPYEDSIHDLGVAEDKHRNLLKSKGIDGAELLDELGNVHSTVVLEKIEAEKEKWIDGLTGLRSKNAFLEELPNVLSLELRSGQSCAMLMLDFDHFKRVNDEHGHDAGDQALKQLAEIIGGSVRNSDLIYRYGGEEFVVFLPNTDSMQARIAAEKIRAKVAENGIHIRVDSLEDSEQKDLLLEKTVSIGMVDSDQLNSWKALVDRKDVGKEDAELMRDEMQKKADSALYVAKNEGRNRVSVWSK